MNLRMEYPIEVLEKSESVLMQRIRRMKDGEPKWAASERLRGVREAIKIIKDVKVSLPTEEKTFFNIFFIFIPYNKMESNEFIKRN